MNKEMEKVAKQYANNRLMRFITISVDPEYDTPEILSQYSRQFTLVNKKWEFINADKDLVFSMAREDFLVDAIADTSQKFNIIHSPMLILVDPQKRIRGYYDSSRGNEQTALLIDEIKVLITEELRNVEDR
jgi:protein SCO1/2